MPLRAMIYRWLADVVTMIPPKIRCGASVVALQIRISKRCKRMEEAPLTMLSKRQLHMLPNAAQQQRSTGPSRRADYGLMCLANTSMVHNGRKFFHLLREPFVKPGTLTGDVRLNRYVSSVYCFKSRSSFLDDKYVSTGEKLSIPIVAGYSAVEPAHSCRFI